MAITETDHGSGSHGGYTRPSPVPRTRGAARTAFKRDPKERLLLWLLIGGDMLFLILEGFTWFYLRSFNVEGTVEQRRLLEGEPVHRRTGQSDQRADPPGGPEARHHHRICSVLAAAFVWLAESAAGEAGKRSVSTMAGVAFLFMLVAIGWQIYQFQVLPFTTIDGAYASTYEFFMGSTLAHLDPAGLHRASACGSGPARAAYAGATWYRVRLIRFFAVWIALSTVILVSVAALFY